MGLATVRKYRNTNHKYFLLKNYFHLSYYGFIFVYITSSPQSLYIITYWFILNVGWLILRIEQRLVFIFFIQYTLLFSNAICLAGPLQNQKHNINFDHYSTKNGMSNDLINAIYHDSKGFIWFGSEDGFDRFDAGYDYCKF